MWERGGSGIGVGVDEAGIQGSGGTLVIWSFSR